MAQKQGGSQKSRTSKKSAHERRSSKPISLNIVQLTLLGKGPSMAWAKRFDREIAQADASRASRKNR